MAHTDAFPSDVLKSVAARIGPRLLMPPGAPPAQLRETFSVWALGLDATTRPGEPIAKLAKPTGRWHHQVSIGNQVRTFARSMPLGPTAADWTVSQITPDSPIAEAIDRAIDWVDKNVQGDPLVKLLIVPSYYLHAFWLKTDGADQILVVHKPDQYTRLKYESLYTPKEFLELLAREPHATGIPPASP
jgi:hypothetical protein